MVTATQVLKEIVQMNGFPYLVFGVYRPTGWKPGTLEHFKDAKPNARRDPRVAVEHSLAKTYFKIMHEEIAAGQIEHALTRLDSQECLQVLSCVETSGGTVGIPMLDIEIAPSEENLRYTIECIKALGQEKGVILASGASYHYYGYRPLPIEEWRKFMLTSLLLDGVVDTRWVAHRMLDNFANLRISRKGSYPDLPHVLTEL